MMIMKSAITKWHLRRVNLMSIKAIKFKYST